MSENPCFVLCSHRYPEPWGEGMREVVATAAGDFGQDEDKIGWAINHYQLPDIGIHTYSFALHSDADADIYADVLFSAEELAAHSHEELYRGGTSDETISSSQVVFLSVQQLLQKRF